MSIQHHTESEPPGDTGRSGTSHAVLGVLRFGPSTGYEIRKLLQETTAHFWKESYGQIYPTLKKLESEGLIVIQTKETGGRESKRYKILPAGIETLTAWICSPQLQLKPGRNELLLKLFFARREEAEHLIPQVETFRSLLNERSYAYEKFAREIETEEIAPDSRKLIGTTIDFGSAASRMQLEWCERTMKLLQELEKETGSF